MLNKLNITKANKLLLGIAAGSLLLTGCNASNQLKDTANLDELMAHITSLPSQAQGNEPSWQLNLAENTAELSIFGSDKQLLSELIPRPTKQGWVIQSKQNDSFKATYTKTTCTDSMTGQPYPWQVDLRINDEATGSTHKLSGCGGEVEDVLLGEWQIEDINNEGIIDSSHITLTFGEEGRVYGSAGCNRYNTSYTLTGENLTFGHGLSTKMACAEALMNQEMKFLESLHKITHVTLDENGALILTGSEGASLKGYKVDS